MKAHILLVAALAVLGAQTSQNESAAATLPVASTAGVTILQNYRGMPWLDNSKSPRLDNSKLPWLDYSRLPWLKPPRPIQTEGAGSPASPQGLLVNLKADIDSAVSGLAGLTDSLKKEQQDIMETGEVTPLAVDYSALMSQDLSTLLSQDLSVNDGQLLSVSLAVPTCPPRPNWNKQEPVVVRTPSGVMVVPTYPPRTPWGNGNTVVTTPGGAVYAMVSPAAETRNLGDSEALRDINRQLLAAQKEVQRLETVLENIDKNLPRSPVEPPPPKEFKPQDSTRLPSDRLPSDDLPSH